MFKSIFETITYGGPVMVPIIIVSVIVWDLIIKKTYELNRERISRDIFTLSEVPPVGRASKEEMDEILQKAFVQKIINLLSDGKKEEAISLCETTPAILPKMIKTLLEDKTKTKETLLKSVRGVFHEEIPRLEHHLPTISVLAQISPLLGLLGTVTGMVSTFTAISLFGTGDPQSLAKGISEALITTQSGLTVAIPALFLYNHLTKRVDNIISIAGKNITVFVNFLSGGASE